MILLCGIKQKHTTMEIIPTLLKEMDNESKTTRKMLERIPDDKYDWKPHPKSMSIRQLGSHIAELPSWISMVLTTTELDFATSAYEEKKIADTKSLMALFETSLADGRSHLEKATEDDLLPTWTLRNGEDIYSASSRAEFIRTIFCQIVHHRAQMGVFLRLLDVPIPGSYGPSADDLSF